jgi:transposase
MHAARPVLVDTDEGWNKNIQFRCSHKTDTWGTKDWGPHQTVQKYRAQEAGKKVPRETVLQHSRKLQVKVSRAGRFFLVITRIVAKDEEPAAVADDKPHHHLTVALDPGVRTFQTAYDADGRVMHFGENSGRRLRGMHRHADHLRCQWTAARKGPAQPHKVARALHERWRKYQDKITRRVRALHEQTAIWLLQHYRVILVSNMQTSKMARRGSRLHPTTRREMLQLAHYRFRQRLVSMARRKPWCRVLEVGEEYTTQTCGKCGKLHKKIGVTRPFAAPNATATSRATAMSTGRGTSC